MADANIAAGGSTTTTTGDATAAVPGTFAGIAEGAETKAAPVVAEVAKETKVVEQAPEAKAEADKAAAAKATADKALADFKVKAPEGSDLDEEALKGFKTLAADLGMDGEKLQKAVDFVGKLQSAGKQKELAAFKAQQESWLSELRADKDFGGEKLKANLALADKALDKFAPELKPFLEGGLRTHPGIVRAFIRIGLADSDDSVSGTQGGGKAATAQSDDAFLRQMYDHPASASLLPKE